MTDTLTRVLRRILKLLPSPGSAECLMMIRGWQRFIHFAGTGIGLKPSFDAYLLNTRMASRCVLNFSSPSMT